MRRRTPLVAGAIILAAILGTSGCAAAAPDLTVSTSELMQSTIVTAADQAAAGDGAGALASLDSLQTQLTTAIGSGEVSAARAARIQDSIDLVRADLQPVPADTPAPEESTAPAETAAPADTVTPVETVPDDDSVPADTQGNGNGNGNNGNGNKDKDKKK